MTRKLQISIIFVLFLLFVLLSMAMSPANLRFAVKLESTSVVTRPVVQHSPTVTPAAPTKTPVSTMQAGNSDWIALIGILIVAIIVIPLILKYKEWRVN